MLLLMTRFDEVDSTRLSSDMEVVTEAVGVVVDGEHEAINMGLFTSKDRCSCVRPGGLEYLPHVVGWAFGLIVPLQMTRTRSGMRNKKAKSCRCRLAFPPLTVA